ncbi:hypothetical protein LR48_Vigan11g110600 [Vigna angularis]|uniref:Uncharacterized protein n=1 Tax=Phaseolus angularis TaxID=3914 RepID=A0A0L9VT91_PHAAN|nr:hypothetical protein LR48_Vigan11g110600 [Vigna angularis]
MGETLVESRDCCLAGRSIRYADRSIRYIFYDSLNYVVDQSVEIGEVVFRNQSKLNLTLILPLVEMCTVVKYLHALSYVPDVSHNSKLLDETFCVHHVNTRTDGCSNFSAFLTSDLLDDLIDNMLGDSDFNLDKAALFDDSPMHADFDFHVADDTIDAVIEEATCIEGIKAVAADGVTDSQS